MGWIDEFCMDRYLCNDGSHRLVIDFSSWKRIDITNFSMSCD